MHIGIDLGTSNSSIAGNIGSDFRIFKTAEGSDVLPSVMYVDKRGHKLFGKRAYDQTLLSPENVAAKFKRLMGTSTKIDLQGGETSLLPEECSGEILKQLLAQAYTETGAQEISGAIITIPAAFNQMQSEATLRAAKFAGLEQVALLQEPIAAAMTASAQAKKRSGQFLIYDLGGGTFDLALVQSISGAVSVLAHEGINMLGGTDFDRTIVNSLVRPWLLKHFNLAEDFQRDDKYRRIVRIAHLAAERAKIELSTKDSEVIFASDEEVRVTDRSGKEIFLEVPITRADLEELIRSDLAQTVELSRKILTDNGYSSSDIDRIVFIGGPTKMPVVRKLIPQELGIPADLQIDPMTAVALGAAIYCESREWTSSHSTRKSSRASIQDENGLGLRLDFSARTSDDKTKIRLKTENSSSLADYEFQIDSSTGWTSGRKSLLSDSTIEVPLATIGTNSFRLTVFDSHGKPLKNESNQFAISRTHANSAGIPATQTISVKVRENAESIRNVLHPLIKKGVLLPAEGSQKFRSGRELRSADQAEHLEFALYQDEGALEPDLNLCIGVFKILGSDLQDGFKIREGDEIIFNWKMSDSGLLNASLELPTLGQSFNTPKFYVPQAGHQSFDLTSGSQIASSVLESAKNDLDEVTEALDGKLTTELEQARTDLEKQEANLRNASDSDTTRSITEKARHIRQRISAVKHAPQNKAKVIEGQINSKEGVYNEVCREKADTRINERFDTHLRNARDCIAKGDSKALAEAERHLEELDSILNIQLWKEPEWLIAVFKRQVEKGFLATNKADYDAVLQKGIEAIKQNKMDDLRRIIFNLFEMQITVGGADEVVLKASSILRG